MSLRDLPVVKREEAFETDIDESCHVFVGSFAQRAALSLFITMILTPRLFLETAVDGLRRRARRSQDDLRLRGIELQEAYYGNGASNGAPIVAGTLRTIDASGLEGKIRVIIIDLRGWCGKAPVKSIIH